MGAESASHLLADLSRELLEMANAVKADAARSRSDYDRGRQFAYYEVISLLVQQADAFGVDRAALGLEHIDPERDLLGG